MAGSPIKRARRLAAQNDGSGIVLYPYMPHAADLPPEWRNLSTAEQIEQLLNMATEKAHEIMSWPSAELDPYHLSVQMQVWRTVLTVGSKASLNGKLGRETARARNRTACLEQLERRLADSETRGKQGRLGRPAKNC